MILLSPFARDVQIRTFLDHTEKVIGRHQDFVMFNCWPEKWIALVKYCMVIDFDLSTIVGTECTTWSYFFTQFCVNDVITGDKALKKFKISLMNIFLTLLFHYLYGFWPFFINSTRHTNLGLFWPNFRMTSERGMRNVP